MATIALAAAAAGALALAATPSGASRASSGGGGFTDVRLRITPSPQTAPPAGVVADDGEWVLDYGSPEFFMAAANKKKKNNKKKKHDDEDDGDSDASPKNKKKNKAAAKEISAAPTGTKRRYVAVPDPLFPDKDVAKMSKEDRIKATARQQVRMRALTNNVVVQIAGFYDVAAEQIADARGAKAPRKERMDAALAKLQNIKILIASADDIAKQSLKDDFPVEDLGVAQGYSRTARGLVDAIAADLFLKKPLLTNAPLRRRGDGKPPRTAGDLLPMSLLGPSVLILSWSNVKSKNGPPALTIQSGGGARVGLGQEESAQTQQFVITPVPKVPGAYTIQDSVTGRYLGANEACARPAMLTTSVGGKTMWAFKLVSGNARQPVYVLRVYSPANKCLRYLSLSDDVDDVVLAARLDRTTERMSWVVMLSQTQPFEEHRKVTVAPAPTQKPGRTANGAPIGSLKELANLGGAQQNLVNTGSMTGSGNQAQQTSTTNSVGDVSYNFTTENKNQQDGNTYGGGGGGYLYGGGGFGGGGSGFGAAAGGPSLSLGGNMSDSLNTTTKSQGMVDNSIRLGEGASKSLFDTETAEDAARAFADDDDDEDNKTTSAPAHDAAPATPAAPPAAAAPFPPPSAPSMPQTAPKKKKLGAGAIAGLVVLVLALAAGGYFGFRWWKNRKAAASSSNANSNVYNNKAAPLAGFGPAPAAQPADTSFYNGGGGGGEKY